MTLKQLKDAAAVVGAVAGIVTGIDKIKTIGSKWIEELNAKKVVKDTKEGKNEPDEHGPGSGSKGKL